MRPPPPRIEAPILATPKQVRAWLAMNLYACGATRLAAEDRVALLTHAEALEEANRRRAGVGDAPFRLVFTKVVR